MRIITFLITLAVIAGGIFLALAGFISELGTTYGASSNLTALNSTFGDMNSIINSSNDYQNNVLNGEVNEQNTFNLVAKSVIKTVKVSFASIGTFIKMVNTAGSQSLGVPEWAFSLLITVITLLFVAALIFVYQGRDA